MKKKIDLERNTLIFSISLEDLQNEALAKIGGKLNEDEVIAATKGIESGLSFDIDTVYNAIFEEMELDI